MVAQEKTYLKRGSELLIYVIIYSLANIFSTFANNSQEPLAQC